MSKVASSGARPPVAMAKVNGRPLDDRRHDAARKQGIVDDVDGDAAGARRRGDHLAHRQTLVGDDDERGPVEQRRREAGRKMLDLARARGTGERGRETGRDDPDRGAGMPEPHRFLERCLAAAHDERAPALEIEEDGEVVHAHQ